MCVQITCGKYNWTRVRLVNYLANALPVTFVAVGIVAFVRIATARPAHRVAPPGGRARLIQSHFAVISWFCSILFYFNYRFHRTLESENHLKCRLDNRICILVCCSDRFDRCRCSRTDCTRKCWRSRIQRSLSTQETTNFNKKTFWKIRKKKKLLPGSHVQVCEFQVSVQTPCCGQASFLAAQESDEPHPSLTRTSTGDLSQTSRCWPILTSWNCTISLPFSSSSLCRLVLIIYLDAAN